MTTVSFSAALSPRGGRTRIIAEIKRASPSAGSIAIDLDARERAECYASAGAAALSVLTSDRFSGSMRDLERAAEAVSTVPVLRKDFLLEELELDRAKHAGASGALLIVRHLDRGRLGALIRHARAIALDVLVECRTEAEIEAALDAGASIVGINNRDLDTFAVDLAVGERLTERVPDGIALVIESGIRTRADIDRFRDAGAANFLVGEALSRATDPSLLLRHLSEDACAG